MLSYPPQCVTADREGSIAWTADTSCHTQVADMKGKHFPWRSQNHWIAQVGRDPWRSLSPTPDKTSVLNFSSLRPSRTCQMTWFIILPRPAFSPCISYFHCWYGSGGRWRKEANFQVLLTFSVLLHVSVAQAFAHIWKLPFTFTKTLQIQFRMSSFEKSKSF